MVTLAAPRAAGGSPVGAGEALRVVRLGTLDFLEACAIQNGCAQAVRDGEARETLLLARHPHTLCTGVLGRDEHVLVTEAQSRRLGLPYYRVDRGGDVMYLGPGQAVAYPIVALGRRGLDPIAYLRLLEGVVISTLADFGLESERIPGLTGVWVEGAKIAGVAIKVSRGVSTHGFNVNVHPDLAFFRQIVTCGIRGRSVTSMEQRLGRRVSVEDVEGRIVAHARSTLSGKAPGG